MASEIAYLILCLWITLMSMVAGNLWGILAGFAMIYGRAIYWYWRFIDG